MSTRTNIHVIRSVSGAELLEEVFVFGEFLLSPCLVLFEKVIKMLVVQGSDWKLGTWSPLHRRCLGRGLVSPEETQQCISGNSEHQQGSYYT